MTRDELIQSNMGLARACAGRFIGKGIEYDDLFSAGCLGLVKAAERFDAQRGCRFSTYAVPVILGEIRLLFREGGSVKLSRSLQELSLKAVRTADEYRAQNGADIKMTELAQRLGVDVYKAQEALNASRGTLSLDEDCEEGRAAQIPVPSGEEELTERLSLTAAIDELDEEERRLIQLRYFAHRTQSDTAAQMNTTQVQISRREKKILMKMRGMLA